MNNTTKPNRTENRSKANNKNPQAAELPASAGSNRSGKSGNPVSKSKLRAKAPSPAPTQPADVIKIGVDQGLLKYVSCRQVDGSLADSPRAFTPEKFRTWLVSQKSLSRRVVVCYEAGLFGFELARWIHDQGMECIVMAPVKLDEGNKRVETDKLNARDICSRLDRYLAGNTRALTACRIPKRQEELDRHQTRLRTQLNAHRKALESQGRCLLWQFGQVQEGSDWWQEAYWEGLVKRTKEPQIISGLSRLRAILLELSRQEDELNKELAEQSKTALPTPLAGKLPTGMGWLSLLILTREIMDWNRFRNRRQPGGFAGLVPSESSTGVSVRQGSITKVGNPVVRTILIEMAWRLVRYQPNYHAFKRWGPVLRNKKAGAAARKKAIVAVARVLGVDLWRLSTGQTTFEKLGLACH